MTQRPADDPSNKAETEGHRSERSDTDGNSESRAALDPIIDGLLARLPKPQAIWPQEEQELWLKLLAGSFNLIYKSGPDTKTDSQEGAIPKAASSGALDRP